jgi:hypothetical protein
VSILIEPSTRKGTSLFGAFLGLAGFIDANQDIAKQMIGRLKSNCQAVNLPARLPEAIPGWLSRDKIALKTDCQTG